MWMDLAGNAFHTGCNAAGALATYVAVGVGMLRKLGAVGSSPVPSLALQTPLTSIGHVDEDSDIDLDDVAGWGNM